MATLYPNMLTVQFLLLDTTYIFNFLSFYFIWHHFDTLLMFNTFLRTQQVLQNKKYCISKCLRTLINNNELPKVGTRLLPVMFTNVDKH